MTDAIIQLQPDGAGKDVDCTSLTVGANTVYRQRTQISGSLASNLVEPLAAPLTGSEYSLPVRNISDGSASAGTAAVSSSLSGTIFNTTPPTLTTGQQAALQSDSRGNLQISQAAMEAANAITSTWTSASALNSALTSNILYGFGNCTFSVVVPSGITGGVISFESSPNNTDWTSIGVVASSSISATPSTVSSFTLVPSTTTIFQMFTSGMSYTRIRLSTVITGTGNVLVFLNPSVAGSELAQIVSGQVNTNDGTGLSLNSLSAGTGMNGLLVATGATNYVTSTLNSTTTQLAAAATFTGTIETVFNEPSASILLVCDQAGILTINQYETSSSASLTASTSFITSATTAGNCFARSFVINGNYINFTFKNNGASTTTTLNLNVAYGNILPATQLLNLPVAINEIAGVAITTGAIPTKDIKDTARNARIFMLDAYTAAPVAEALQSVVQWYSNAAVAGTTTPAVVPAGKILRLTSVTLSTKSLATVGSAVLRIRANTAGTAVIGSPLVWSIEAGSKAGATTVAMTGGLDSVTFSFPDGLEFPAGTGLGFTLAGYGPTGTLTLEGVTRFVVTGFEY